jgi:hypothetical protein
MRQQTFIGGYSMRVNHWAVVVALFVMSVTVGCNKLKGDKGDTGAAGPQGSGGAVGAPGEFFEFTGVIPANGLVSVGSLSNDSLVAVFSSNNPLPHNQWWPHVSYTVDYQAGTVTYAPFSITPGWTYKIIVIHNPSSQSNSLL